jgi:hypothetical protein
MQHRVNATCWSSLVAGRCRQGSIHSGNSAHKVVKRKRSLAELPWRMDGRTGSVASWWRSEREERIRTTGTQKMDLSTSVSIGARRWTCTGSFLQNGVARIVEHHAPSDKTGTSNMLWNCYVLLHAAFQTCYLFKKQQQKYIYYVSKLPSIYSSRSARRKNESCRSILSRD